VAIHARDARVTEWSASRADRGSGAQRAGTIDGQDNRHALMPVDAARPAAGIIAAAAGYLRLRVRRRGRRATEARVVPARASRRRSAIPALLLTARRFVPSIAR